MSSPILPSKQPKALYILSLVELWERFGYYGVRALLMFYMISELGFSDASAYGIYGMYFALVSAFSVVGGFVADRYLGSRKAIYFGSLLTLIGHGILAIPFQGLLTLGLAFIVVGTGFFKTNVTALLGQLYQPNDPRRDSGFTIFYMGINLGALLAPFICGYIGHKLGWHYGFGISGIGILLGFLTFYFNDQLVGNFGNIPDELKLYRSRFLGLSLYHIIIMGTLLCIPVVAGCIHYHNLMGHCLFSCGIITFVALIIMAMRCHGNERNAMLTLIVMMPFFVAFWTSFEQVGSSINLFIDRHVNRTIMGYEIPTTWFLSLNPFLIIVLGQLFSSLWLYLRKHNLEPIPPYKFALAFFQSSLSFWCLVLAIQEGAEGSSISLIWILLYYTLRTTSELCIAPIALSMVTKLAPARLMSFMMGVFFLSIAFAQVAAQQVAQHFTTLTHEMQEVAHTHDQLVSLSIFGQIFEFLIFLPLIAGVGMLLIAPLVKKVFEEHP